LSVPQTHNRRTSNAKRSRRFKEYWKIRSLF